METHYSPGQIKWTREQVIWILKWSELFESGKYPPDFSKETGYIGGKGKAKGFHAPFETPKLIFAELALRIARTNPDGYFLSQVYSSEDQLAEMDRIARAFNLDINEVSARVERALKYVTGWCRRWQKCSNCRVKDCPKRSKKKAYDYTSYRY